MSNDVVIYGAGGHGRVCAEVAAAAGFRVVGYCDAMKDARERINGIRVVGGMVADIGARFRPDEVQVFAAVGDNAARMRLRDELGRLGFKLPLLVHPASVVSPSARIGDGTVVMANVVINANAKIGRDCILNTACSIDHDNILEDEVQISPGVRSAGTVHYRSGAFVGTGAILIPGIRVGARAVVAAGAVVVNDVPDDARVAGVPAKPSSAGQSGVHGGR